VIADEVPLEFLRRAAMREHLFLRLAHQEPRGGLRSVLLFDSGPRQLGAPRLVHLALLVLFAERAAAARTELEWGVLQDPETALHRGLTAEIVHRLLDSRSHLDVTPGHLAAWSEELEPATIDDLWTVAPTDAAAASWMRSRVEVEDPLHRDRRVLDLRVKETRRPAVSLQLDLPNAGSCTRLLRNPFAVYHVAFQTSVTPATGSAPALALNGKRLLLATAAGGVTAYHVPQSANQIPGSSKSFDPRPGEELVAVGFAGRRMLIATRTDDQLVIYGAGHAYRVAIDLSPGVEIEPLLAGDRPTPCLQARFGRGKDGGFLVVDRAGGVFLVQPRADPPEIRELWRRTTAVAWIRGAFAAVVAEAGPSQLTSNGCVAVLTGADTAEELQLEPKKGDLKAHFGVSGKLGHPRVGLVAVRDREDSWLLIYGTSRLRLEPREGARVVGVGRSQGRDGGAPALVVLGDDRHTLSLQGRKFVRRIVTSSSPILDATTSAAAPILAYREEAGETVVLSLAYQVPILKIRAERRI
jgi:hypothetical protein